MESSSQGYSLKVLDKTESQGETSYDTKTGFIAISFMSTANFVLEVTHAGQFETGDLAFSKINGMSALQDLKDEVDAYKAQFAFDPSSVSGLTSTSSATSFEGITSEWVQGFANATGVKIYALGSTANTGLHPVKINSSKAELVKAYPLENMLRLLPNDYTTKTKSTDILFKGQ